MNNLQNQLELDLDVDDDDYFTELEIIEDEQYTYQMMLVGLNR